MTSMRFDRATPDERTVVRGPENGLASVYRQAGAVYGGRSLDGWDKIEEKAQQKRLGIWSEGVEKAELSSDFKAKQKAKQKK